MYATLHSPIRPDTSAAAIVRLRCAALDARDASPDDSTLGAYARLMVQVLDMIDVCRLNGHTVLLSELWTTARQLHERMLSLPKLRVS